ncbi:sensor histidine kinase [Hydrogenovibrio kuenenii]|uniref:sensor histidine kinase n=1 Tax=Hydrogenovibrio kuenenii TaxID=63658 RepID=UPI0004674A7C|nr:sensor histidine kinase [Hydrogenovibrio kuenenii]
MRSIEKSLNISLFIGLSVIFIVFWLISVFSLHHLTENYVVTRLHHDNDSIIEHLKIEPDRLKINLNNINPIYSRLFSGHYFVAKAEQRLLKSPSLDGYPLYLKPIHHNPEVYETLGPDNQTVLIRGYRTQIQNESVTLYVAEDHSPIRHTIHIFDAVIAALTFISLIALYFLQRYLLQKGFNRLTPINSALAALHKGKAVTLNPQDYPTEVTGLIESLNQAVDSASTLLEKSRQSNANLAHSLKTPLNIIFQIADSPTVKDYPEIQQTLSEQSQKILRLIERELKSARLASGIVSMTPFSLRAKVNGTIKNPSDLEDLISSFQQLYPNKTINVKNTSTQLQLPIEKEDGFELLGNLIDNACKYGQSQINIELSQTATHFVVHIEDDGKGVPDEALEQIQQRGFRLDENIPGHGIGLSIVKQIVSAYHGDITFSPSELGGLSVEIQLPQSSNQ